MTDCPSAIWLQLSGCSYLVAGMGPPLVLLHGAGDNSLDWQWVMPALAATHRIYAPDLPGSPDSARPAADYSPAFFERSVAAFVDALNIGRVVLAGNSLGGLDRATAETRSLTRSSARSRTLKPSSRRPADRRRYSATPPARYSP